MLAIAGGKGGCGKTTTALGLATALDVPTVAVDADQDMPDLHSMAGVDRRPTLADGLDAAQQVPGQRGTRLLPAPPHTLGDRAVARRLADVEAEAAGVVVVDCPGGAGPDAAAPLSVADEVILVSTPCAPALRDAAKTAAMARALGATVHGAVLSQAASVPDGVASFLDCPVLGTVAAVEPPVTGDATVRRAHETLATTLDVASPRERRSHV